MIPTSELKIGNIITGIYDAGNKTYEEVKVVCIDPTREITECEIWVDGTKDHYDDFEPIKLTEEWLKKCGFDDSEYKTGYICKEFHDSPPILDFVLTKPGLMGEWQTYYAFELRDNRFVPVKYIHRLQNLFYEITNEELIIKQ